MQQNTSGEEHSCGFCSFGCECVVTWRESLTRIGPYGEKQGTVETFMVDAAKHGTQFLDRAQVDRLLFSTPADVAPHVTLDNLNAYSPSPSRTRCFGGIVTLDDGSRAVIVATRAVIVSGGSVNSPAILLRSGLKNPVIGKNLHLHPCSYVTGTFPEKINPWDGSIMTAVS
jgi:long-chain-alcohol oxidase